MCQPANADLNLAADDVFLCYSLQDKLSIAHEMVRCDTTPNVGAELVEPDEA